MIGGEPTAVVGPGVRVAGTGHWAHPARPQLRRGPNTGADTAAWAANAGKPATLVVTGWSRQSMACSASAALGPLKVR